MCKYCNQKAKFNKDGKFERDDNVMCLAKGFWSALEIGVDEKNRIVMYGCGDDWTDEYYPKFCPECGRKLAVDS